MDKMFNVINTRTNQTTKRVLNNTSKMFDNRLRRYRAENRFGIIDELNEVREKDKVILKDQLIYFDIETVKFNEPIDVDPSRRNTTTKNYLYQYSLATTNKDEMENIVMSAIKCLQYFQTVNILSTRTSKARGFKILPIGTFTTFEASQDYNENVYLKWEYEEETGLYYFNTYCEDTTITLKLLSAALQSTTLSWYGYNSNSFDSLIFGLDTYIDILDKDYEVPEKIKHLVTTNKYNEKEYREKYTLDINSITKSMKVSRIRGELKKSTTTKYEKIIYDGLPMCKAFGLNSLKKVGDFVNCPKLKHDKFNSIEDSIKYNNIDVKILFLFVKYLNVNDIFLNNYSDHSRRKVFKKMFENYNVDYIHSSAKLNKFELIAARTESYQIQTKNSLYFDANSLYPSTQMLDVTCGEFDKEGDNLYFKLSERIKDKNSLYNLKESISMCYGDIMKHYNKHSFNIFKLTEMYDNNFNQDYFYLGFFKIKGYKKDLPEIVMKKLNFYFPFSFKEDDKRIFQFRKDKVYQIGFYELAFLSFFDFDIVEVYAAKKGKSVLKEYIQELYYTRKTTTNEDLKKGIKVFMNTGFFGIFATKKKRTPIMLEGTGVVAKFIKDTIKDNKEDTLKENLFTTDGKDVFKITKETKIINENKKETQYYKTLHKHSVPYTDRSIPLVFQCITSHARSIMFANTFLNNILSSENKLHIQATDTDSIFATKEFIGKLKENNKSLFGDELLQFKDELKNKEIKYASFIAPKTYSYLTKNTKTGKYEIEVKNKGTGIRYSMNISTQTTTVRYRESKKDAFSQEATQKRTVQILDNGKLGNFLHNKIADKDYDTIWGKIYSKYAYITYTLDYYIQKGKLNDELLNKTINNADNTIIEYSDGTFGVKYNNRSYTIYDYIMLLQNDLGDYGRYIIK